MYTLAFRAGARRNLRRLDSTIRTRILSKLEWLCENCDTHHHKAIRGPHRGKFRLRIADAYRVIYTFNKRTRQIFVHETGHRSSVY
ncbi:MAG: type II toxin-antitoxin system RelE/ParE family toxin [Candidatus Poribacteria bacterium]|nr:type II toxin-antitoxin system RelE/ParE family toxin [Candidatus Poribacteria bacterium]